jgi:transketolase
VLIEPVAAPEAIIVATGSEVQLACAAALEFVGEGLPVRVVSMPCVEIFEEQDAGWRNSVLPADLPVVAVEAGATRGWWRHVGRSGAVIGIDRFGESAPAPDLFAYFRFTPRRITDAVRSVIAAIAN